jgi:hypothetical protein
LKFAGLMIAALSAASASAATYTPLFHGAAKDCDGPNFGGHVPNGFTCKGTGTGVAVCTKGGKTISADVQVNYCHLDWFTK